MATIYDVAKVAGVSPKTVSRVLNGDAPVGEKTSASVRDAIATLGYVPSPAARSMRSNRSGLIGLITGAISQSLETAEMTGLPSLLIAQGIQRVIGASPLTLMIADTGSQPERIARLIETFRAHRVEGLIYTADYHAPIALPASANDGPLVLVNCFDQAGTPAVLPDDRGGQFALVREVIAAGHRRVAFLTLQSGIVAARDRYQGYRDALQAAGIAYDPVLVAQGETEGGRIDQARIAEQIETFMALDVPPTVICCGNDSMAITVYGILRARGLSVPGDVSVVGYDNHRLISETLYPALTTAELPYVQMGERAAERLLAMIAGTDVRPAVETVPGRTFWRASVHTTNPEFKTRFQGRIP